MAEVTLAEVKAYCKIDFGDDDDLVTSLMASARAYLIKAGVPETALEDERSKLVLKALVLDWYDARGMEIDGTTTVKLIQGARSILNQLKGEFGAL